MVDIQYPTSIDQACRLLSESAGDARLIAGGVALMVLIRHQLFFPNQLISLKRIPGLDEINYNETHGLRIGALATHNQIERSALVRQRYPALAECVHHVGNLRVRNMGTLVGDLCQADNHSDPAPILTVLGAKIKVQSIRGERLIPMEEFHRDIYETALAEDEVVAEVLIPPLPVGARTAYLRFSGNSPIDWPMLSAAGMLVKEDGVCRDLKITLGSLTATPMSFDHEAEALRGRKLTAGAIRKFARACAARLEPIVDDRGSEWYKRQIGLVYIRRTLESLGGGKTK